MADQHPYGYEERFKFTGKERDSETNYDYFGARFYASLFGFWLSVDPLSDKYPNISPYAYCNWNPIKFVDPDGLENVAYNFNTSDSQEQTSDIIGYLADICESEIFQYNLALITRLAENANIHTEYVKFLKSFSTALTLAEGYNLYKRVQSRGWTLENISDAISLGLGIVASKKPEMLMALICLEEYKILGQWVVDIINTLNTQYGDYNFMMDIFSNGYK